MEVLLLAVIIEWHVRYHRFKMLRMHLVLMNFEIATFIEPQKVQRVQLICLNAYTIVELVFVC